MLGVRIDFRIDIYSEFRVNVPGRKDLFWKLFLTDENRVRNSLFNEIHTKDLGGRVSMGAWETENWIYVDIYITYYMFFIQYCNFYLFWIFLFGWSILKKSGKSGYFRYLFLHFKSSSLLGENFDAPCWELRIDLSKSHTHKMFWFMEKIGNFCLDGL